MFGRINCKLIILSGLGYMNVLFHILLSVLCQHQAVINVALRNRSYGAIFVMVDHPSGALKITGTQSIDS